MAIERERKFLVVGDIPENYYTKKIITQAYLVLTEDTQLRLRLYETYHSDKCSAEICYKKHINDTDRVEIEYTVCENQAKHTIEKKDYLCMLKKIRFYFDDGWEVDLYLNGLAVAEYEFSDKHPFPETIPDWIGKEITGVKEYSNIHIAQNFNEN